MFPEAGLGKALRFLGKVFTLSSGLDGLLVWFGTRPLVFILTAEWPTRDDYYSKYAGGHFLLHLAFLKFDLRMYSGWLIRDRRGAAKMIGSGDHLGKMSLRVIYKSMHGVETFCNSSVATQ